MEHCEDDFLETSGDESLNISGISVLSDVSNHDISGRLDDPEFLKPLVPKKRPLTNRPTGTSLPKRQRKKSDGPKVKCSHCNKEYASKQTLHNHLKKVNYNNACLRLPDDERIIEEVTIITPSVLREMQTMKPLGPGDEQLLLLLAAMQQALLVGKDSMWMFITAVAMSICRLLKGRSTVSGEGGLEAMVEFGINSLLNNLSFVSGLVEQVKWIGQETDHDVQDRTIYSFLYLFYKQSCDSIVIWLLREMRPDKPASFPKQQPSNKLAQSEEAACYFSIGSVVNSDKNRTSKNPRLGTACCTDGAEAVPKHISGFTNAQNRGGLKLSNIQYYKYAQSLVLLLKGEVWKLICKCNQTSHDLIFGRILDQGEVMELWKNIIGDVELNSDASVHSFEFYTRKIMNTFMRGVINLIKNSRNQDKVNLALRAKLAGSSQASSSAS